MNDCYDILNDSAPLSPASDEWMMYSTASTAPLTASTSLTGFFDTWNDLNTKQLDVNMVSERLQQVENERRQSIGSERKSSGLPEIPERVYYPYPIETELAELSRESSRESENYYIKREDEALRKDDYELKPKKRRERKKLTSDQKIAHNKIEKKYRVNINSKILGLAEVVPSLQGACRLNKSAILERAANYILELRAENDRLRKGI